MAVINIEWVPISKFHLGKIGAQHLMLTFNPSEGTAQDSWFVYEGLRVESPGGVELGVEGTDGVTTLSMANDGATGAELAAKIGTPSSRSSTVLPIADALNTWEDLAVYAYEIAQQEFKYRGFGFPTGPWPTQNSTSVIASLVHYAGLDPQLFPPPRGWTTGSTTLLGTTDRDEMYVENGFHTLIGGKGSDIFHGSDTRSGLERFFGGHDDDFFFWNKGINLYHGGQQEIPRAEDGLDTVGYYGAGEITITLSDWWYFNFTPDYDVRTSESLDRLYSIERIEFDPTSDYIVAGEGIALKDTSLLFDFGEEEGSGQGDVVDFSTADDPLVIEASTNDRHRVQQDGADNGEEGVWLESVEWIIGSAGNDVVYAGTRIKGVEGSDGDDLIDARLGTPFSGISPQGYDIEIDGGEGNDTIVSGRGRTLAEGGAGSDRFVLSETTGADGTVEFVIADADAGDRLFLPYNFFNMSGLGFEGSELMPVLGAMGKYSDMVQYGAELLFDWNLEQNYNWGNDYTAGVIDFVGGISYKLEGADLVIRVWRGIKETETIDLDGEGNLFTLSYSLSLLETETLIRVTNFQEGDLGLMFHDPGEPVPVETITGYGLSYPNWDAGIVHLTNNGVMGEALELRPETPVYELNSNGTRQAENVDGTAAADNIETSVSSSISAGGGNDTIVASSYNDSIDGGTGDDTMTGGGGNDTYVVDTLGDVIVEAAQQGNDSIQALIDYVLPDHVENLELVGGAVLGTGNAANNYITGNDRANTLTGLGGDDGLMGGLGDDVLVGGAGSDGYVFFAGDGADVVIDDGPASETDSIVLFGITPAQVTLLRTASSPADLVLDFGTEGRITVRDHFTETGRIEEVVFEDGTVWSGAAFEAMAAAATTFVNDPPRAIADLDLSAWGPEVRIPAAVLFANDQNYDGDPLSIVAVANAEGGTVTLQPDGSILFSTAPTYSGTVAFDYTISDGRGGTSTARVEVLVGANFAPIAGAPLPAIAATEDVALDLILPAGAFTDADQDPLRYAATLANGDPLPAWLAIDPATGRITGTPPAGAAGTLDVVVTATDGVASASQALSIVVAAANVPGQTFTGTGANETFTGTAGNDTFRVVGDGGLDQIDGGGGTDRIEGSVYADVIRVSPGLANLTSVEVIDGGAGNDRIEATSGNDVLDFSAYVILGIEKIDGGAGNDAITGSAGNDAIFGGTGNDVLAGGAGDDTFSLAGDGGLDVYDGGAGFDTVLGSGFNDVFRWAGGAATFAGIERIDGGAGTDRIEGTAGADEIDLSGIEVIGIERIDGGLGNDTITGSAGADLIFGNVGNDTMSGGHGDDVFGIAGDGGFDVIDGGAGFDTVEGSAFNDVLRVTSGLGNWVGVERADGGAGTDRIEATAGNDTLDLSGLVLAGIEKIDLGAGADSVTGSAGNDTFQLGTGGDTLVMRLGAGHDAVLDFTIGSLGVGAVDRIDVSAFGYTSFGELMLDVSQSGADTLISFDAGSSLRLVNFNATNLNAQEFIL